MIKKVFNITPEGNREAGSGKAKNCVWQDIRILGVRNWRSVASNYE
jgi:hypothetical protein